jgi:hypothetical protein
MIRSSNWKYLKLCLLNSICNVFLCLCASITPYFGAPVLKSAVLEASGDRPLVAISPADPMGVFPGTRLSVLSQ